MIVRFSRRKSIVSWLIRFITWSDYSHVEVLLPSGKTIGATGDGVKIKDAEKEFFEDVEIKLDTFQELMIFKDLFNQLGKGYDFLGMVGWWFRKDWQNKDRWFCSELIAWVLKEHAIITIPPCNRVTPSDLYLLLKNRLRWGV